MIKIRHLSINSLDILKLTYNGFEDVKTTYLKRFVKENLQNLFLDFKKIE